MGKKLLFFLICLFAIYSGLQAQLSDQFDDGNFSANPTWAGNSTDFIVNDNLQLQSNNSVASNTFYISTPNSLATSVQWEFFVQVAFNTSSTNYVDAWLLASDANLGANATSGYFVRIGNTDDEISLYRKSASGGTTKIIDGVDDLLNSNNELKIKVIRNADNQWTLLSDGSGTGNSYTSQGTVIDATYQAAAYFGFLIKQSTASFFGKHFFDDIEIKNYVPDTTPPLIQSATAISSTQVDVLFNEPLGLASSQLFSNYSATDGLGMPTSVVADAANTSLIHLGFDDTFSNGKEYTLTVNGVKDISGNAVVNATATFSFYIPQQYDIVIDELIADATPQIGLPNNNWVELTNTSSFPINLMGWRLGDLSGTTGPMPSYILQPDSFVIVCTGSAVFSLMPFGNVISVSSFLSLDNDGELIFLTDETGKTIHALEYSINWYTTELKKEGGWSLEMIDPKNPCIGFANWKASTDASGGTPGKINSVNNINTDDTSPKLMKAFATSETSITLVFDEPVEISKAAVIANYSFDNGLAAIEAIPVPPLFKKVNITLSKPITEGAIYSVSAKNVTDCMGNLIGEDNHAQFGIAQQADSLDLVINEILVNPIAPGVDYVEIYNRSSKIIDLNGIYLANRNSSNEVSSIEQVSDKNLLLFPGEFMLLSPDVAMVKSQFITTNPNAFLQLNSFPSYSDNEGNVLLLNNQGKILDEINYTDKWHFTLITNTEGVALERIDYDGPSIQSNFHSAATTVGYGTPGYKNSQYRLAEKPQGKIELAPEVFSPDNDGIDDFLTIHYSFAAPGFVTNITIFDATGRPVRYLQKNSLGGIKGYYRWDGLDDKKRKLPQGIYIVFTEIFNTDGKKEIFKNTVVLARKY